jgi:hypothetical protein
LISVQLPTEQNHNQLNSLNPFPIGLLDVGTHGSKVVFAA